MSKGFDAVMHDVPIEYRDRFQALLNQDRMDLSALQLEVEDYLSTVQEVGPMVALIDVTEAERLAQTTLKLLSLLGTHSPPQHHQLVQAAVHYFVCEDEDEEVTGVLGFDDDIQVVNAVCRALNRPDLVIPLTRKDL